MPIDDLKYLACHHPSMFCTSCHPTDGERDRRLKAFMPLIEQVSVMAGWNEAQERIERILEVVENPLRRVANAD